VISTVTSATVSYCPWWTWDCILHTIIIRATVYHCYYDYKSASEIILKLELQNLGLMLQYVGLSMDLWIHPRLILLISCSTDINILRFKQVDVCMWMCVINGGGCLVGKTRLVTHATLCLLEYWQDIWTYARQAESWRKVPTFNPPRKQEDPLETNAYPLLTFYYLWHSSIPENTLWTSILLGIW